MVQIKLTKNALREQQKRLAQLERYLPTLQLKKAMLQSEVNEARIEIARLEKEYQQAHLTAKQYSALLTEKTSVDPTKAAIITKIHKRYENIAGVDVPYFETIEFAAFDYSLVDTPAWLDTVVAGLRQLTTLRAKVQVAEEKKHALEEELRQVSIRVNLFEKNLIPTCQKNIKKIKVFLGDQELSAVGMMKVAKGKIESHKRLKEKEQTHAL
ncbi:MAG: V-type ATP synthase subunit D [Chlamydiales bacterium]